MLEIARNHPDINIGVSFWGQGDNTHLLWAKDHLLNIRKYFDFKKFIFHRKEIESNYIEYSTPALTWTRRLFSGNRSKIIDANVNNFIRFEKEFGKIDIIHVQAAYPAGLIAKHLSDKFNIPYVVTVRMSPFPFGEFIHKGLLSQLIEKPLKNASMIIAISESLEKRLSTLGHLNVRVIHNLVNENLFSLAVAKPLSVPFKFLFIGRLVPQKGLDVLFHAMPLIKESDFNLTITGKGQEESRLKKLAKSLNIDHLIRWEGELERNEIAKAIQNTNCLILPSRHETFGNVLTEALACGKPVIATSCGGPEDIVNDTNGLLVNVGDPEDLANKMSEMVTNYNRYSSKEIRTDFEKRFSSKVITPQIVKIYREVINNHIKVTSDNNE